MSFVNVDLINSGCECVSRNVMFIKDTDLHKLNHSISNKHRKLETSHQNITI